MKLLQRKQQQSCPRSSRLGLSRLNTILPLPSSKLHQHLSNQIEHSNLAKFKIKVPTKNRTAIRYSQRTSKNQNSVLRQMILFNFRTSTGLMLQTNPHFYKWTAILIHSLLITAV